MLRILALCLAVVVWVGFGTDGKAQGRVALVIGNGNYEAANPLKNPTTDAQAVQDALAGAGFEVIYKEDLNYSDMVRELGSFQRLAAKSDSAVIYFAGHGMEIDKQNFLIPVDAQLEFVSDADFQTVPLQLLQRAVSEADVLGLVIVDACRNNPFATRLSQIDNNRGVGFGLARVEPGGNTVVALAAREGTFAFDGKGENSPYAVALVRAIETPGLEIGKLFRQLHDEVLAATNGAQEPVQFGNLPSLDYYFLPPLPETALPEAVTAEPSETTSIDAVALQVELAFWQAAVSSGKAEDFALYLESYPAGNFAPLARARLARTLPESTASANAAPESAAPAIPPDPAAPPEPTQVASAEASIQPAAQEPATVPEPLAPESVVVQPAAPEPAAPEPAAPKAPAPEPAAIEAAPSQSPAPDAPAPEPVVPTETAKAPEPAAVAHPVLLAEPAEPAGPPAPPQPPALAVAEVLLQSALADTSAGEAVRAAFAVAPPDLFASFSVPEALPELELSGKPLIVALQLALTNAGCNPGPIDGDWGSGSTRALAAFGAARPDLVAPEVVVPGAEPSAAVLRAMALAPGLVCLPRCATGEKMVAGSCQIAASCPAGQKLSSKGACYVPEPAPRKPAAKAAAKGCTVFNGRKIC